MKVRLNLTIEDDLLNKIKRYAASKQVSVSELVEEYFKTIAKPKKQKNSIIDLVEKITEAFNFFIARLKKRILRRSGWEIWVLKYFWMPTFY